LADLTLTIFVGILVLIGVSGIGRLVLCCYRIHHLAVHWYAAFTML
jgi:hypothetical protein